MVFHRTMTKLEDARVLYDDLKRSTDAPTFRTLFNSFITAARAITNALQKEGRHIAGFQDWYGAKQREMKSDDLLRFIHKARIQDFHQAKHRLQFGTYVRRIAPSEEERPPGATKWIVGPEGPFWVVDEGTPQERRVPIKRGQNYTTRISIDNAPSVHLGGKLTANDPLTICHLALAYYSKLVREARDKFELP